MAEKPRQPTYRTCNPPKTRGRHRDRSILVQKPKGQRSVYQRIKNWDSHKLGKALSRFTKTCLDVKARWGWMCVYVYVYLYIPISNGNGNVQVEGPQTPVGNHLRYEARRKTSKPDLLQYARGQTSMKRVRRETKQLQQRLMNLCCRYRDAKIMMDDFLRGVAHCIRLT